MMRSSWLTIAACLACLLFTTGAMAQKAPPKKMPISKKVPLKKGPLKKVPLKTTPAKPGAVTPIVPQSVATPIPPAVTACLSRAAILGQEQEKLDNYKAQAVGTTAEINQLQRRIKELTSKRKRVNRLVANQGRKVKSMQVSYKRQCKKHDNCDRYEAQASSLERQSRPIENALNKISSDITDVRKTMSELRARIAPLRAAYQQNKCGNLVPGQTTQAVINKCSSTFSEWNNLQAAVNSNNQRLSSLKSSYRRYSNQLDSLNNRATSVSAYLSKNCSSSPKKAKMDRYQAVRERAKKLGAELDDVIREFGKLKKEPLVLPR